MAFYKQPGTCLRLSIFLFLVSFTFPDDQLEKKDPPTIGIIGGGIGGTSAAYFLRELFGSKASIDLFEKEAIGGRLATVSISGNEYEAGGSIIHPKNLYMVNFTDILGLKKREDNDVEVISVFNGKELLFTTSQYTVVTLSKLFWRYGLDVYNVKNWIQDKFMKNFSRIYKIQEEKYAYTTVTDLISAMDPVFVKYLKKSIRQLMKEDGFSDLFIDEMVMGGLRMNYGQTPDIHAFVGAVSLAGIEPGLWNVRGGNKRIPEKLVKKTDANVIDGEVTLIRYLEDEESPYEVHYVPVTHGQEKPKPKKKQFDIVVIATPLHNDVSDIKFEDFPQDIENFPQKYHKTIATFVEGEPNLATYGLDKFEDLPDGIFTSNSSLFLNSFGKQKPVDDRKHLQSKPAQENFIVGKIFSNKVPDELEVQKYFPIRNDIRIIKWLAYPEYDFYTDELPPFVLHDRLYYINGIELAASAMEMSAIGAKNVALLAYNHWYGHYDKINEHYMETGEKNSESKAEL